MMASDFAIASDKAKIGTTAIKVGLACIGPGLSHRGLLGGRGRSRWFFSGGGYRCPRGPWKAVWLTGLSQTKARGETELCF